MTVFIEFAKRHGDNVGDVRVVASRGDPKSPHKILSIERNCYSNCVMNKEELEKLAERPLTIVGGSLGLCSPSPTWFEWGGNGDIPHKTVVQFCDCIVPGTHDMHFWLESEDEYVWDVLDPYLVDVATIHKKRIDTTTFLNDHLICGESKAVLQTRGLLYISAQPLVQQVMKKRCDAKQCFVKM